MTNQTAEKGAYKDFMSKEINEQYITSKTCIKGICRSIRDMILTYIIFLLSLKKLKK